MMISTKGRYALRVMIDLAQNEGGYKLVKKPAEYTIGSILKLTEGTLAPVGCLEEGAEKCDRATECITLPLWKKLDDQIDEYLESVTLEDLVEGRV